MALSDIHNNSASCCKDYYYVTATAKAASASGHLPDNNAVESESAAPFSGHGNIHYLM